MTGKIKLPNQKRYPKLGYNGSVLRRMTDFAGALAALLRRAHFVVRGDSMAPALRDGDIVYAIPCRLGRRPLRRGDIVVARNPMGTPDIIIKRIAGLPGDWIGCGADGAVSVIADANVNADIMDGMGRPDSPAPSISWVCDADEFFLIGDNRAKSVDSRKYGPLSERAIIGRVGLVAPMRRLRLTLRPAAPAGHND